MPILEIDYQQDVEGVLGNNMRYLGAVMRFPNDRRQRDALIEAGYAAAIVDAVRRPTEFCLPSTSDGELNQTTATSLRFRGIVEASIDGPAEKDSEAKLRRHHEGIQPKNDKHGNMLVPGGHIAALVLLISLYGERCGAKKTIDQAKNEVIRWLSLPGRRFIGKDTTTLQKHWKAYQDVAHLWAAYVLNDCELPRKLPDVIRFLHVAQSMADWVEKFKAAHSRWPLLDDRSTWRAASIETVDCSEERPSLANLLEAGVFRKVTDSMGLSSPKIHIDDT
jgi:hypothetical protein